MKLKLHKKLWNVRFVTKKYGKIVINNFHWNNEAQNCLELQLVQIHLPKLNHFDSNLIKKLIDFAKIMDQLIGLINQST
jgi:hypothetical protein